MALRIEDRGSRIDRKGCFSILGLRLVACLALSAFTGGCGERTITIKGQLLHKGQPLDLTALPRGVKEAPAFPATVIFRPATDSRERKGKRYRATVDMATSTYEVQLPPGKYRASVFVPGLSACTPGPPDTQDAPGKVYDLSADQSLNLPVERP